MRIKQKNPLFRPLSRLNPLQTVDMAIASLEEGIQKRHPDAAVLTRRVALAVMQKLKQSKTALDRCEDIIRRGLSDTGYPSAAEMLLDLRRVRVQIEADMTDAARAAAQAAADAPKRPSFCERIRRPLALTAWMLTCAGVLTAACIAVHYLYPSGLFLHEVEVPSLVGENIRNTIPDEESFALDITYQFHAEVPSGQILSQRPTAGMTRRVSARHPCTLSLTVSLGPEQVQVGDLCGMTKYQALTECRRLGLIPILRKESGHPSGNVARTEPAAGEVLDRGSQITLYIGTAAHVATVVVPNLVGNSEIGAGGMLTSLGLRRGEVTYMDSDAPVGAVIAQSVLSGTAVASGTRVSLVVSRGKVG